MPLPTRKAPPAVNKEAPAASTGKTRLPPRPQGGLKAPKSYQYLSIPKEMERCTYLVRMTGAKQQTSEKTQIEKFLANFEVLETDVKHVRIGSEISEMMPLQGEQALYFWKSFAPMCIALAGGDITDESLAEFEPDCEATYSEVVEQQSLVGQIARCDFRRGKNKDGKDTFYRDWSPATEAEIAKYSK